VIIEYEPTGALQYNHASKKAVKQIREYMEESAKDQKKYHKYYRVVLEGKQIMFLRYYSLRTSWEPTRNFDITPESVGRSPLYLCVII
jgi:hypothetical protein